MHLIREAVQESKEYSKLTTNNSLQDSLWDF